MRRRSRLAVTFVALLTVGLSVVTTEPSGLALAADPEAELAKTRAQLADARSAQQSLEAALANQRSELKQLEVRSANLGVQLNIARAELAAVTAEYTRVVGLLNEVRAAVAAIEAHLVELGVQITALNDELTLVAADIEERTNDLRQREALLEAHLRSAYERSQTSLLELLLGAKSLDEATTQVGYLMTVSDADKMLAEEIRSIRAELKLRRATLEDGRRALAAARAVAREEEARLVQRRAELVELEARTAELKAAAEAKRAQQEAALNASLHAEQNVEAKIAANERAFTAAAQLSRQLAQRASAQANNIAEARRRAAAEARQATSAHGFRWPERSFRITQEWGPTSFALEPPYTYRGTYYPHFHGGIDFANGCGTPIYAAGPGVVVASGQPLMPWDTGFGVIVDHGGGIQTWYWHMQARVIVAPGRIVTSETVIGYEGSTGMSTGCHVHFAVNHHGVWENPRAYLP